MPIRNSTTVILLRKHIEELEEKIDVLDSQKANLVAEKIKAELALNTILPKRARAIVYNKDSTSKQKVIYCLKFKRKILSINDILQILFSADETLKAEEKKLEKSIRLAVFRLSREEEIVNIKTDEMKTIHYALKSWLDEKGELLEIFHS